MFKFAKITLLALAVFLVLGFSITANAGPPTPNVNVVNTPDVNVVNTPDVNVVNTPDVNVVNDLASHVELSAGDAAAEDTGCSWGRAFYRIGMDGILAEEEFVVPDDYALIVTDVSWSANIYPTVFTPGRVLRLSLITAEPDGSNDTRIYLSSTVEITEENKFGLLGGIESWNTGFLVGPGRIVCPNVNNNDQNGGATNTIGSGFLRGKLVPINP